MAFFGNSFFGLFIDIEFRFQLQVEGGLIDVHAHLTWPEFDDDFDQVIEKVCCFCCLFLFLCLCLFLFLFCFCFRFSFCFV